MEYKLSIFLIYLPKPTIIRKNKKLTKQKGPSVSGGPVLAY